MNMVCNIVKWYFVYINKFLKKKIFFGKNVGIKFILFDFWVILVLNNFLN